MKPFNITEALAHPERVVHRDGRKAVQVAYFPKASAGWEVMILWEGKDNPMAYGTDGKLHATAKSPDVFLSTPPEQVPFSLEGFKAGWQPIYRNGEKPLEVKVFEFLNDSQPVSSVNNNRHLNWHCADGSFWNGKEKHALDLFLIKPAN